MDGEGELSLWQVNDLEDITYEFKTGNDSDKLISYIKESLGDKTSNAMFEETSDGVYVATPGATGRCSISLGWGNQTPGASAFAEGYRNIVPGTYGFAFGNQNLVEGRASGAIGISNYIIRDTKSTSNEHTSTSNLAMGSLNTVGGISNIALGNENKIGRIDSADDDMLPTSNIDTQFNLTVGQSNEILYGKSNFVSGKGNTVTGNLNSGAGVNYNIVSGYSNTIQGINFFGNAVFGQGNSIIGANNTSRNFISGYNNTIQGIEGPILFSSLVGENNNLYSGYSHIFGSNNKIGATGVQSNTVARAFIAGQGNTYTTGTHGYIFGKTNTSNGSYTTILGVDNKNNNEYYCTTLIGNCLIASNDHQFITGKYNDNTSNAVFQIGRGSDENARANIFEIYSSGNVKVTGSIESAVHNFILDTSTLDDNTRNLLNKYLTLNDILYMFQLYGVKSND